VVQDGRIQAVVAERQAPAGRRRRLDGLTLLLGLINLAVVSSELLRHLTNT
jgi:hypothetical protein